MASETSLHANAIKLPRPPREPDLDECCGSGCDPCVFDLYEQRLERWRARCEALQLAADSKTEQPL